MVTPRRPRTGPGAALLFPGAGSAASHPSLVAIEAALAPMPVSRADFPYRREGRRAPDRAPKLMAFVIEEAGLLAERTGVDPAAIVLGGRSMGGRMCSMAVAEGLPAAGLVLISYPLHPPGKPDRLRIEHLPALRVPCLLISGARDAFGTPAELEEHTASIPGPVTHVWIEGKGHDLKGQDSTIASAVADWVGRLHVDGVEPEVARQVVERAGGHRDEGFTTIRTPAPSGEGRASGSGRRRVATRPPRPPP